ncbi:hypothetical protein [Streptomyces sp. T028]
MRLLTNERPYRSGTPAAAPNPTLPPHGPDGTRPPALLKGMVTKEAGL